MSNPSVSVLLLDAHSPFAPSVVRCLSSAGARVHALSRSGDAPVRHSRHVASFHTAGSRRDGGFAETAAEVFHQVGADVCLSMDQSTIRRLAVERHHMSVPSSLVPSVSSFDTAEDKWSLACFMLRHGLPHPATFVCSELMTNPYNVWRLTFPVLLKPRRAGYGHGIVRIQTTDDLLAYLIAHADSLDQTIVQSELPGRDIACSVLCDRGEILAHTIQRSLGDASPRFQPAGTVEFVHHPGVLYTIRRLMSALNWSGVAQIDLRENPNTGQVDIIEINPRFWGSLLGSLQAGVNFPYLACLRALDHPLPASRFTECHYAAGRATLANWAAALRFDGRRIVRLRESSFRHALTDPGPTLHELMSAARGVFGRSIRSKVTRGASL